MNRRSSCHVSGSERVLFVALMTVVLRNLTGSSQVEKAAGHTVEIGIIGSFDHMGVYIFLLYLK